MDFPKRNSKPEDFPGILSKKAFTNFHGHLTVKRNYLNAFCVQCGLIDPFLQFPELLSCSFLIFSGSPSHFLDFFVIFKQLVN